MTLQEKIKEQIKRFKAAIYGEDVREAFADIAQTVCIDSMESVDEAIDRANDVALDLERKRDEGAFIGEQGKTGNQGIQGIQGIQGEKGDKGERGESGITAEIDGMYTLYINDNGELIAQYPDTAQPPPLSINEHGDLIYTTGG